MKDPRFIQEMIQRGKEAGTKARSEFTGLSSPQLNWKHAPDSWSVAQCLDHVAISDSAYFPTFERIVRGNYSLTFWERSSPFSGFFGRLLVSQVKEQPKNRMKAPKLFSPSASDIDAGIVDRFTKHQTTLLEYIAFCDGIDVDKTIITSPPLHFITYSLRNAITLLIQHEHRHINQAVRVKQSPGFPA